MVGPNGAGKTTLLHLAAGMLEPDAGAVIRPAPDRVVYVPQDYGVAGMAQATVADYLAERMGLHALERELRALELGMAEGRQDLLDRYSDVFDRFAALGGWDAGARAARALADVGLPPEVAERPLGALSGGEQVRAGLAATLASRYELYLLDEPTNNLDEEALGRLERFVAESAATFLIVSHDRVFLERVAGSVLLLDPAQDGVELYGVPYAQFTELRARAQVARAARWEAHRAEVERLAGAAERQSANAASNKDRRPPRDNDKFAAHFLGQRQSEQAARSMRRLEQRLARLDPAEQPHEPWQLRLALESGPRSGDLVVEARDAVALGAAHVHRPLDTYSPGERCRLGLALLTAGGANCLVLDEPTNHLDLEAVEQLEQALGAFDGTLVVVSHDRRFLREVGVGRRIRLAAGRIVADGPLGAGELG